MTSIGLDGEKIDQVTFLPKPRIHVYPGYFIATTEACLKECEIEYRTIRTTSIRTAIGKVVIIEALSEGNVLVAGPSTIPQMEVVINILKEYDLSHIFVDGAFSRHSTASISNATIFCVGANYSQKMDAVVDDAAFQVKKFTLPTIESKYDYLKKSNSIMYISHNGNIQSIDDDSALINPEKIIAKINEFTKYVYFPKAVGPRFIKLLIDLKGKYPIGIVLHHPTALQVEGMMLKHLFILQHQIYVLNPMNVLFVAINPYSPRGYEFDSDLFKEEISSRVTVPVINVLRERE